MLFIVQSPSVAGPAYTAVGSQMQTPVRLNRQQMRTHARLQYSQQLCIFRGQDLLFLLGEGLDRCDLLANKPNNDMHTQVHSWTMASFRI